MWHQKFSYGGSNVEGEALVVNCIFETLAKQGKKAAAQVTNLARVQF